MCFKDKREKYTTLQGIQSNLKGLSKKPKSNLGATLEQPRDLEENSSAVTLLWVSF